MKTLSLKNTAVQKSISTLGLMLVLSACGSNDKDLVTIIDPEAFISIKGVTPAELTPAQLASMNLTTNEGTLYGFGFLMGDSGQPNTVASATRKGADILAQLIQNQNPPADASEALNQSKTLPDGSSYEVTGTAQSHYERADANTFNVSASTSLQVRLNQVAHNSGSNIVGPDHVNGSLSSMVRGTVTTSRVFDVRLFTLANGEFSLKRTVAGHTTESNSSYKGFGVAVNISTAIRNQLREAAADPLGQSRERRIEILENNIGCIGSLVLDGQEFGCAEIIQAKIRAN